AEQEEEEERWEDAGTAQIPSEAQEECEESAEQSQAAGVQGGVADQAGHCRAEHRKAMPRL
ncbi:unnamed protein product, partial [Lampetra planeri]